jgi:NADH:ubiquinone oxidoreductase subunit 3 (subunit A)
VTAGPSGPFPFGCQRPGGFYLLAGLERVTVRQIQILIRYLRTSVRRLPYECGVRPLGDAWIRFGVNYYIYALIFLAFEVDVLYLLPVSVVYHQLTMGAFVKVFLFVLALAVLFFWAKGVFTWPRRIKISPRQ